MSTKPWLNHYPKGLPVHIDETAYPSVTAIFQSTIDAYGDRAAFILMGKSISFKQLGDQAEAFGAYLHSRGLEPGDRIVLMMPNILQYPIAMLGALKAGLILVNTNPLYTPREMLHQINDSGAKAIVIAENFAANLEKILPETGLKVVITTSIGEMLGFPKGAIVNFVIRKVKRMVPAFNIPNTVSFTDCVKEGKKFTIKPHSSHPDDVVIYQYTGGTTGLSKGAMLTNKNLVSNMLMMKYFIGCFYDTPKQGAYAICPLPLYHIFAFTVNVLALSALGYTNVLVVNARDIKSVLKTFKEYPIALMTGINTLYNAMMNHPDFGSVDFSHLKVSVGGGMAVQRAVAERWQKLTGVPLCEGYGMTESSPVASANPLDGSGKLGSIGIPMPSTEMRVVNDQGEALPIGEVGEIQIKGPQVMKGYYNKPEETAKTITADGWLCTGDMGLMHEDGYFQIVDRKKDMILVSGFNVYPNEVEDVIAMMPEVAEVAAVGVPDDRSGEVVKVFVVKKDANLNEQSVLDHCRKNLTNYKVPKHVEFRSELPKTNVGKILRRALRDC